MQSSESPYPLIPVVHAARAIVDTALQYKNPDPVRAMVTKAVQRNVGDVADLLVESADVPRQRSRNLRQALHDVREGARSIAEAKAADRLKRGGVAPFELNVPILDPTGKQIYVADVLWRDLAAILEIDSREYHYSEADWKSTMVRHNRLTALGYSVTHYPPSVVMGNSTAWVAEVRAWLDQRRVVVARAATSRR